ncbi:MAG: hypothetical protein Q9169_002345 [Polycauliona sp. 2 TL-2023]
MGSQGEVEDEHPAFQLTHKDHENLARKDEDFKPHTWTNLRDIIGIIITLSSLFAIKLTRSKANNDLESLRRWPSDLKRYLHWSKQTKQAYGTITNYICQERLQWQPLPTSYPDEGPIFHVENPVPFADPRDYKIMYNDWPYGMTPDITHIVVWLKTRFDVEPTVGDLLPEARTLIEDFVKQTFNDRLEEEDGGVGDRVMWFRNWTGLQSVRGMDHIHVLVRGVPQEIMDEWTGGRTTLP